MRRLAAACLVALPVLSVPASASAPLAAATPGVGRDMEHLANIPYSQGTDLEFATVNGHDYAIAAQQGGSGGIRVIDIDNPASPVVTGFLPCRMTQNDVQVRGDKVLIGFDGGSGGGTCFSQLGRSPQVGLMVVSIANPASPQAIGFVHVPQGVHNATWHPGGRYVYTSDSALTPYLAPLPGGQLQIVDLISPTNPVHVGSYTLLGDRMSTHDITFNASGSRAYVAALQETYILDTTNPLAPRDVARIEDPSIMISHGADPTPDGRYLLITDEQNGAVANGVCNVGGVHVYDLLVEAAPVKVGFYVLDPANSATATVTGSSLTCTAHVLDFAADGQTWTNANYAAGVRVVSATQLVGRPAELAYFTPTNADTWSAKTYKDPQYVFANDLIRGFDVYRWVPGLGPVDTRSSTAMAFRPSTTFGQGAYCFTAARSR